MATSYKVGPGDLFGRIGTGFGKGLADQVPKEIERERFRSGLEKLGNQKDLTPFQQFSGLVGAAHEYPQVVQSGSDLLRQQARGQALSQFKPQENQPAPNPFTQRQPTEPPKSTSETPSLTNESDFAKTQQGFIPRTEDQKLEAAGKRYTENPALFSNNPQNAIDYENKVDETNKDIAKAHKTKHDNLTAIQDNVVKRLRKYSKGLNVNIPERVYSKIEDKAIQATKPKKIVDGVNVGGDGLTEQQAMKEYNKELDGVSRDYQTVKDIGNWGITGRPAKNTLRSFKSIQEKSEERGDTEDVADTAISANKISPITAYAIFEPVSREPNLNKALNEVKPLQTQREKGVGLRPSARKVREATLDVAEKIAPHLGSKGSPLASAYELDRLGYDPDVFLDYVEEHRRDLNLTEAQGRQIDKPRNVIGTLNDWWLGEWSGLDEDKRPLRNNEPPREKKDMPKASPKMQNENKISQNEEPLPYSDKSKGFLQSLNDFVFGKHSGIGD